MNFDSDSANTDDYFVTALQIFDCCGVESSGSIRVDALMDKFTPLVKTNKAEFSYLKKLLDPEQSNPDINVSKLAKALHKYSDNHKTKVDLDESFNLKCGQAPQDSDSGISTDGLQLLEELQCELKEKEHLAHQLRSQLDFTDRQHEEALASVTAERDSLLRHLNMVRDENATLSHVRRDYDEVCERLCVSETALGDAKRELDALRKKSKLWQEHVAQLESDKLTLQELLSKSKAECHRINEMYATRQSTLLGENEALRAERAELSTRAQDQEDFMQQIIKEKVLLEMELKDVLNKSNQTHLRLDRSIDVSYTEEQMLTVLDTINADSQFSQENRVLDGDSFLSALKEDQGRVTNMSLFDEIRLSFNMSRHNFTDRNIMDHLMSDNSIITGDVESDGHAIQMNSDEAGNETDFRTNIPVRNKLNNVINIDKSIITIGTQTENEAKPYEDEYKTGNRNTEILVRYKCEISKTAETQTDNCEFPNTNNNTLNSKCLECENANKYNAKLEKDVKYSNLVVTEIQTQIAKYEENLVYLQRLIDEGKDKNRVLTSVIEDLNTKIGILQAVCEKQGDVISNILEPEVCCVDCQTELDHTSVSTQVEVPCADCEKRNAVVPHRTLRKFFWDPLKRLFQLFAVICIICAVWILSGVTRRSSERCRAAPWSWLHVQDFVDLLLRIEYTTEVPM